MLLWIHGGGFIEGSAIDQRYNLSFIVQQSVAIGKPIIGVSINYRLGVLGFIESAEVAQSGNTNLGLRDQRLALHWIHENIASFGGDPTKVTIWGESEGAFSVGFHLLAYGGRDDQLFRGAVMDSGSPVFYIPLLPPQDYQSTYNELSVAAGCNASTDSLQCLREVPFEDLNTIFSNAPELWGAFSPAEDGDFIQGQGSDLLSSGDFVHVPIIIGTNTDEGTYFASQPPTPKNISTDAEFTAFLEGNSKLVAHFCLWNSKAPSLLNIY